MIPRRQRRSMSQINVVPYIDVMLVLLIIFMVTAPFIAANVVELPSLGQSSQAPTVPLEVVVAADGVLHLRDRASSEELRGVNEADLGAIVAKWLAGDRSRAVVISADKAVRYEAVMRVMDTLQKLGIARIGLMVKPAE